MEFFRKSPRILIFSIAMGANYSLYVKTIETHERAFLALNILAIGRVLYETELFVWSEEL